MYGTCHRSDCPLPLPDGVSVVRSVLRIDHSEAPRQDGSAACSGRTSPMPTLPLSTSAPRSKASPPQNASSSASICARPPLRQFQDAHPGVSWRAEQIHTHSSTRAWRSLRPRLGVADGHALVEACLVVEVLQSIKNGTLRFETIAGKSISTHHSD